MEKIGKLEYMAYGAIVAGDAIGATISYITKNGSYVLDGIAAGCALAICIAAYYDLKQKKSINF